MEPTSNTTSPTPETTSAAASAPTGDTVHVEEILVEEISIDGMCGVY
jgi:mycofactocin precursor